VKELSVFSYPLSVRKEKWANASVPQLRTFLAPLKKSPFYSSAFETRLMQNKNPPASSLLAVG